MRIRGSRDRWREDLLVAREARLQQLAEAITVGHHPVRGCVENERSDAAREKTRAGGGCATPADELAHTARSSRSAVAARAFGVAECGFAIGEQRATLA